MTRALLLRRAIARLIDLAIIAAAVGVVAAVFSDLNNRVSPDDVSVVLTPSGASRLLFLGIAGFGSWALMIWIGALWNGRTPGRALTGLRVVAADCSEATPVKILGRDLLRAGSIAIVVGLAHPAGSTVLDVLQTAGLRDLTLGVAIASGIPVAAALALIGGSIASQPQGRGLHDRLAGTLVVSR